MTAVVNLFSCLFYLHRRKVVKAMEEVLEMYTIKLPKSIKKAIRVLAATRECTQQELLSELVKKEVSKDQN